MFVRYIFEPFSCRGAGAATDCGWRNSQLRKRTTTTQPTSSSIIASGVGKGEAAFIGSSTELARCTQAAAAAVTVAGQE